MHIDLIILLVHSNAFGHDYARLCPGFPCLELRMGSTACSIKRTDTLLWVIELGEGQLYIHSQ
jgi:hypothetical protein